jgi:hypothetical protein
VCVEGRDAGSPKRDGSLCHLFAIVENGIVASKPQEFRRQPLQSSWSGYVSVRCGMWKVDEDTFTMISGLIVVAVACIAGLLAVA